MKSKQFWIGLAIGMLGTCLFGSGALTASKASDGGRCIPAERAADHLHSII